MSVAYLIYILLVHLLGFCQVEISGAQKPASTVVNDFKIANAGEYLDLFNYAKQRNPKLT